MATLHAFGGCVIGHNASAPHQSVCAGPGQIADISVLGTEKIPTVVVRSLFEGARQVIVPPGRFSLSTVLVGPALGVPVRPPSQLSGQLTLGVYNS